MRSSFVKINDELIAVNKIIGVRFVVCFFLLQPVYPLLSCPLLLYTAHLLLEVCRGHLHGNTTPSSSLSLLQLHRWRLRCLYLQQRVIGQRSASLWEETSDVIEKLMKVVAEVDLSE